MHFKKYRILQTSRERIFLDIRPWASPSSSYYPLKNPYIIITSSSKSLQMQDMKTILIMGCITWFTI